MSLLPLPEAPRDSAPGASSLHTDYAPATPRVRERSAVVVGSEA